MSYGLNKVMLIGNLGGDPELKYLPNGTATVTFSLATNESYKDNEGNLVKRTEWHRIVAWRKPAEILNEYLKKGSKVYIEGRLQTRSWEDKEGQKRYMTEVQVDDWMFLDGKGDSDHGAPPASMPSSAPAEKKEDDLPF
jgi:single-strand DNA-binding protein